ncbi:MAG: hypothetical protein J5I94_24865 [Phaeodactylibacter sp.]|nr:hypothetical protein [Phaeodactylibacter sp.]
MAKDGSEEAFDDWYPLADFDKDVEEIGEEIKAEWWEKNKERFIESQSPDIEEGEGKRRRNV